MYYLLNFLLTMPLNESWQYMINIIQQRSPSKTKNGLDMLQTLANHCPDLHARNVSWQRSPANMKLTMVSITLPIQVNYHIIRLAASHYYNTHWSSPLLLSITLLQFILSYKQN